MLSLTQHRFDFRKTFDFEVVEKYSYAISDWKVFKVDKTSVIQANMCLMSQ